jgi:hypothetical protein
MGGSAGYTLPRIHYVIDEVFAKAKELLEDGKEVNLNPYLLMGTYAVAYVTAKAAIETVKVKLEAEGKDYQVQYARGKGYTILSSKASSPTARQQFQCEKCPSRFPSEEILAKHIKSFHRE